MKSETFECEDSYEAEKLAGLLAVQKDNSIYVLRVAGAVENEIIIMLKDKSSHSVTLKDEKNVRRLRSLIEDVVAGGKTISECTFENNCSHVRFD
jgi:coenzyme F420-reducing hydrogenase delta subunit